MKKFSLVALLFFVGCAAPTFVGCAAPTFVGCAAPTFVTGIVRDVDFVREDNANVYVIVRFEDKVVKLRSYFKQEVNIPINRPVTINYDRSDLQIQSVDIGMSRLD